MASSVEMSGQEPQPPRAYEDNTGPSLEEELLTEIQQREREREDITPRGAILLLLTTVCLIFVFLYTLIMGKWDMVIIDKY
jgi:hypothetical protein